MPTNKQPEDETPWYEHIDPQQFNVGCLKEIMSHVLTSVEQDVVFGSHDVGRHRYELSDPTALIELFEVCINIINQRDHEIELAQAMFTGKVPIRLKQDTPLLEGVKW